MENEKPILRGELALMAAIVINSFSVVLMLYSGSGISAISSVPYAFSEVFKELSLGTWTYIFQGSISVKSDDPKKKVCTILFIQLCCRLCFWRNA